MTLAREWSSKAASCMSQEDYACVIDAIRETEKHTRALTLTLLSARAHVKLGKLVTAQKLYRSIVATDIAQLKPPAKVEGWRWIPAQKQAHEAATSELRELTPRIPFLTVIVSGADPLALRVTVDGEPLDVAQLGRDVPCDPGKHTVLAEVPGKDKATQEVELKEGATETVRLALNRPAATPNPQSPMPIGSIVAFSVGGVGLVVGAIAGGVAVRDASLTHEICEAHTSDMSGRTCADYFYPTLTISRVSTVGFAFAFAGAGVGTVLYLMSSKNAAPLPVGVAVGPGFISATGSF